MKAARFALLILALGFLTGPSAAHAEQATLKALLTQGFFYGPLPGNGAYVAPDVQRENDLDDFIGFMSSNRWKSFSLTPMGGIAFASLEKDRWRGEGNFSPDEKDFIFRPVLGFDIARPILINDITTITPEAYIVYRHEMLNGVQAGVSLGFKMGNNLAARLSLDSNLQPQEQDHRAIFYMKFTF